MFQKRTRAQNLLLILKGIAIGAVNKIPGVSGGLIALLTGIYFELLYSLKRINLIAIKLLLTGDFKKLNNYINGNFLFNVFLGIIISYFSMSLILGYLLKNYPEYVWGSFLGMILASIYYTLPLIKKWDIFSISFYMIGLLIGIIISFSEPFSFNNNFYFIFLSGIISVSGIVLPGLSGSYLLILLGNYELLLVDSVNALYYMLQNLFLGDFSILQNKRQIYLIKVMIVFGLGSISGLYFFVNILNYLLKKFYKVTMSIIVGFITGSIFSLWPWRKEYLDGKKEFYFPINFDKETILILIFIILGITFVFFLEKFGKKNEL